MQENTNMEKPENSGSLDKEEHLPDAEEATSENVPELDLGFEGQEEEFLPPQEKKKSGAGKVFLFLILVLAGSGSYLYFNNLIPAEILNLVFPKSAPSKPPALVTQTPLFMEEVVAETPEPVEVPEAVIAEPASPPENQETHVSGAPVDSMPSTHLSGTDFDQTPKAEESQEILSPAEPEPTAEQEVIEEMVTELIAPTITEPALPESDELQRTKAVQTYLDFIESSIQKLGELIKEGFNLGRNYLNRIIP